MKAIQYASERPPLVRRGDRLANDADRPGQPLRAGDAAAVGVGDQVGKARVRWW